ncbi:MAG: diguanylate cyclase [Ramlibacter sp.]|nr:diguanylate cyclase [Ramlibacter sp.]
MSELELAIWSAASGAIGLVVLVCVADLVLTRTAAAAQGTAYNFVALCFVVLLSGLPRALLPELNSSALHTAQVLIGPLCTFLGNYWVRGWLSARHRDRFMDRALLGTGIVGIVVGMAALGLPRAQQLPAAATVVLINIGLSIWMCVRARMHGDALALGIAIGSALMLVGVGGLYGIALGFPAIGIWWQALIAADSVLSLATIGAMLWKRNERARRQHGYEPAQSQYDPVTKLRAGAPFVRQLVKAQERRRRTSRDGAVIAVLVFQPERIVSQAGAGALNEVYLQVAQRLQKQLGAVNPVGRYWDRCFVALSESIHSPSALRTMGLRVATAMRRPMHVKSGDGVMVQIRVDIGVGVVHLDARKDTEVEDLLHEAEQLAEAARAMPSRAAMRDPLTGDTVPVEKAQLGHRRRIRAGTSLTPPVTAGLRARA